MCSIESRRDLADLPNVNRLKAMLVRWSYVLNGGQGVIRWQVIRPISIYIGIADRFSSPDSSTVLVAPDTVPVGLWT